MQFHLSPSNLLKSETKVKIIKFILKHEALMSEREIASVLKVSHMSVNRTMQELAAMNMVHYVTVGKAHLWKVNRKSYMYRQLEQLINSLEIVPDPLKELKKIILKHLPKVFIEKIILFGSIARAAEQSDSDIDLFILVKNDDNPKKIEEAIEKLSSECFEVFGNRLSPYILTQEQYKQKQGLNIVAEVHKGIQIYPNGRASP